MSTKTSTRRSNRRQRFQAVLDQELARARGRIRAIDCFSTLLLLLVAGLGYFALVLVLDSWLRLSDLTRQMLLFGLGLGSAAYLYWALVRPLFRDVNPYYAARELERSAPESKNALVNWLDLRAEPLPAVIRDAVQRQAVEELEQADVDEAIPTRRPMRLFMVAAACVVVLIGLRLLMPEQFGSLFARALYPFTPTAVPTSTRFELKAPVQDEVSDDPLNAAVMVIPVEPGLPVPVAAAVHGRVPDAVVLEYQATLDEKPRRKALNPPSDESRRLDWSVNLPSDLIPADGLYFRIRGGDGQSRLYHLVPTSRRPPSVSEIDVVYHYPRYTNRQPKRESNGRLKALIGTKVELTFTADQPIRSGTLGVQAGGRILRTITLQMFNGEAERARERVLSLPEPLVLGPEHKDKASYLVTLINRDSKSETSQPYSIEVEEDQKPQVTIEKVEQEILKPDQAEVHLATNDVATIVGRASDDIAVNLARLHVRTAEGKPLRLLAGKTQEGSLQKATGTWPPPADYQFILNLGKLTDKPKGDDTPFELKEGDRLEMWVEATDNREPEPNVGKSRRLTIILTKPLSKERQEEKQKEADDQAEQREKDQQEKAKDGQKQPEQESPNEKNADKKPGEDQKPGEDKNAEKKPSEGQKPGEDKNTEKRPSEGQKPGEDKNTEKKPSEGQKPGEDKNAEKKPSEGQKPGEDKNAEKKPSEGQKPGEDKNAEKKPSEGQKPGEDKNAEKKPSEGQKPGEDKNAEKKPSEGQKPGEDKNAEKKPSEGQKPGEDKNTEKKPSEGQKPGEDKNTEKKPSEGQKPGEDKNAEKKPSEGQKPGEDKNAEKKPSEGQKPGEDKNTEKRPSEGQKPGEDKNTEKKPSEGQKPGEDKNAEKKPSEGQKPGEDKNAEKKPSEGQKPGEDKNTEKKPSEGQKPGEDKNTENRQGEAKPADTQKQADDLNKKADELAKAIQQGGGEPPKERSIPMSPPTSPDKVNEDDAARAKDLLLDTFRKKMERNEIDKDVLRKMNWTEAEAREFMKQYEAAKRSGMLDRVKGTGGRTVSKGQDASNLSNRRDLIVDSPNAPPAELRENYDRFNRNRAEARTKKQ